MFDHALVVEIVAGKRLRVRHQWIMGDVDGGAIPRRRARLLVAQQCAHSGFCWMGSGTQLVFGMRKQTNSGSTLGLASTVLMFSTRLAPEQSEPNLSRSRLVGTIIAIVQLRV